MSREVKRVPLDFDWPLDKVWSGYQYTEEERERWAEDACPDCENGYAPRAQQLYNQWYGKVHFEPYENGSTPYEPDHPAVRAFAERNVTHSPEYYGRGEAAIQREARRLADLFNSQLSYHLNDDDVTALRAADRLPHGLTHRFDRNADPRWQRIEPAPEITAAQLNEKAITGGIFGDAVHVSNFIEARCAAEGVASTCPTCDGHASLERYPGQRAEAEAWEPTEPPTGDGWQLWETVSEGSPISPVFATAEELAQWLTTPASAWGAARPMTISAARKFVQIGSSLGSFVQDAGGLHDGADYVGTRAVLEEIEGR